MSKVIKKNTLKNKNKNKNKNIKKLEQFGGNNTINVLSWNICWQAMMGKPTNGTANELGAICKKTTTGTGLNYCANNVIKLIDTHAVVYDFIAIQEAAKWKEIRKASTKLQNMGYVHHKSGTGELVTFYNKEKYIAIAVNSGNINFNKSKTGRPYHIIYLQNKTTKEVYIFINLHNAHNIPLSDLETELSKNFTNFISISDANISNANEKKNYYPIDWSYDKYNVIVAGDFNDHYNHNYWRNLHPFKNSNIEKLQALVVKTDILPPPTCCKQEEDKTQFTFGDYILVNEVLTITKDNYIPEAAKTLFPASDHHPVSITLQETDQLTSSPFVKVTKYIYAFDIDDTLCPDNAIKTNNELPTDDAYVTFRTKIIENMKKVIASENYIWIVTTNKYTKENFVNKYFDQADPDFFNRSKYFYYMNAELIKRDYEASKTIYQDLFKPNSVLDEFNGRSIHNNGLKPFAIYRKSLMEMVEYNKTNNLKISNFKIFLFDNNDKPVLLKNCHDFNITLITVTDFTSAPPNLLSKFGEILFKQEQAQEPTQVPEHVEGEALRQEDGEALRQEEGRQEQGRQEQGTREQDEALRQEQGAQEQAQEPTQVQEQQQRPEEQAPTIEMKRESSSGSMFAIPLLAMVCAVPFIFLLSK